jgi:hypothetical protein
MNADKNETLYVDASAAPMAVPLSQNGGRSSHLCCGFCCDTRRATIIVNIINVVMSVLALVGVGILASDNFANQLDDDAVKTELSTITSAAWVAYLISALAIVCGALGIYGAKNYNGWMVMVSGIWYSINAVLSIIGGGVGGALMSGFFAYPHFVLYQEMKKGIMTEANYPNEKHSCCCV